MRMAPYASTLLLAATLVVCGAWASSSSSSSPDGGGGGAGSGGGGSGGGGSAGTGGTVACCQTGPPACNSTTLGIVNGNRWGCGPTSAAFPQFADAGCESYATPQPTFCCPADFVPACP